MDKIILLPSITFGTILIIVYLYRCKKTNSTPEMSTIINSVFNASGVTGGVVLMLACIFESVMKLLSGIEIYIFVSGLALLFVSSTAIFKDIFSEK